MAGRVSRSQRLIAVIGLSSCFFLIEISIGLYTHSLALVADAFHYLNDLVGFVIALVALKVSETDNPPKTLALAFGWQRAPLLGAFFNGALLFALGISILLQSVERFISLHEVENPKLMLIVGCVGLGLNVISATVLHEPHTHGHEQVEAPSGSSIKTDTEAGMFKDQNLMDKARRKFNGHDLGMMGVLLHVIGDAANNLGVIIAALVIWLTHYEGRYYADPGASIGIAVIIILSSLPLLRRSGLMLLGSAPSGVNPNDIKDDLEKVRDAVMIFFITSVLEVTAVDSWGVVNPSTRRVAYPPAQILGLCSCGGLKPKYGIQSVALQPDIAFGGVVTVTEGMKPEEAGGEELEK